MKLELSDVARSLNLPVNTVERWIRQGRIPVRKTGTVCIFKKAVLEKWAEKHEIHFRPPVRTAGDASKNDTGPETNADSLVAALKRGGVHTITGSDTEEIFRAAIKKFDDFSEKEKEILYQKLIEREKLTSTGIGKGVAIPHPRTPLESEKGLPVIATFFLEKEIDFNAIDDRPVNTMFLIVCPSVKTHLHLLSLLSFCIRDDDFVSFLNTRPQPAAFYKKAGELENYLEKNRQ